MEKGVTYNIVDSVKGGCGKTTFAIMLAMVLDERKEWGERDNANVCLIDMDLQGTSLEYLLFGKREKKNKIYLNEKASHYEGKEKEYIEQFVWKNASASSRFDVVLSSPNQAEKNKYKAVSSQNYSPEVLYSTFRMGLRHMLGSGELLAQDQYGYEHIIFDMPPNSDGYSDAVYDCMLKEKYSVRKKEDRCNLFIVQTLDRSQGLASLDYFRGFLLEEEKLKLDKVFFVFNNYPYTREDDAYEKKLKDAAKFICDNLKVESASIPLGERWEKKLFFVGVNFCPDFYGMCLDNFGIENLSRVDGLLTPVSHLYRFDQKEISGSGTEALRNLMEKDTE